jgi:hypothetical protein
MSSIDEFYFYEMMIELGAEDNKANLNQTMTATMIIALLAIQSVDNQDYILTSMALLHLLFHLLLKPNTGHGNAPYRNYELIHRLAAGISRS